MDILEELARIEEYLLEKVPIEYVRELEKEIDWDFPVIGIVGARGVGKTTLILQHLKIIEASPEYHLYISADNPMVLKQGIYDIGRSHFTSGGISLIVDEVHKYPDWSIEIKALHDTFPDRKIIVLGSSKLSILLEKGDLSRRMRIYEMPPLSFREYLYMNGLVSVEKMPFEFILENHAKISVDLVRKVPDILKVFKRYLRWGCYPFFKLAKQQQDYLSLLRSVVEKVIYEDLTSVRSLRFPTIVSVKKLIAFVASSPSPQISVSSLTKDLSISRETLYDLLDILEMANVLRIVRFREGSLKGSKVFLYTPDVYPAISFNASIGTIREAFFAMNFKDIKACEYENCDFLISDLKVEIGRRSKSSNADIVFKDDLDIGYKTSVPLYLAGFVF